MTPTVNRFRSPLSNPLPAIFRGCQKLTAVFSYRIAIGWFGGIQVYKI
jgi:hypothetical protein